MENKELTEVLGEALGGLLGMFQALLQDEVFLSIARLMGRDSRSQENLSLWTLWTLHESVPYARDAGFWDRVKSALDQIDEAAANVRKHRHKRIAHFDLPVTLGKAILPAVTFKEIRELLEQIEAFLNLFYWEFGEITMDFNALLAYDITEKAEVTTYKARAYDLLEAEGVIPKWEWKRRVGK